MKECTRCKLPKFLDDFSKLKTSRDGRHSLCKKCINLRNKKYREDNKEQFKKNRKRNYNKNIEKERKIKREYYKQHKEEKHKYDIEYRKLNKQKIAKYKKDWEMERRNDPIFKIKRNLIR